MKSEWSHNASEFYIFANFKTFSRLKSWGKKPRTSLPDDIRMREITKKQRAGSYILLITSLSTLFNFLSLSLHYPSLPLFYPSITPPLPSFYPFITTLNPFITPSFSLFYPFVPTDVKERCCMQNEYSVDIRLEVPKLVHCTKNPFGRTTPLSSFS